MRLTTLVYVATTALLVGCGGGKQQSEQHAKNELRAPAYPLVTIDPYTSAWSMSNQLYDAPVKHWTGKNFPLLGVAKVDGKAYRFMGAPSNVTGKENIRLPNPYRVGKRPDLTMLHGKRLREHSERKKTSLLQKLNGEVNTFGYAVR